MKVGFLSLLATIFIGLKLTGVVAWPWLWVLSPIWLPIVAGASFILILLIFASGSKKL